MIILPNGQEVRCNVTTEIQCDRCGYTLVFQTRSEGRDSTRGMLGAESDIRQCKCQYDRGLGEGISVTPVAIVNFKKERASCPHPSSPP